VPALVLFRAGSVLQNVAGDSALALAIIGSAIVSQRGIRPGFSLLSRTSLSVRWACWIAAGLVLVSLCSDGWVHVFHYAARDVSLNLVAEQVRESHHPAGSPSALMLGVSLVVAAPVAEELLFRGLIFNVFAQARKWVTPRYGSAVVLLAAILSSLFFALAHTGPHGDAANTVPDRFVMGMVLCAVYWQTGSLLPGVVVHAGWNFGWLQVAALGLHPAVLGAWPAIDVPIALVALAALAAVSGAAARRRDGRARSSCSIGQSGSS
jgi:membrane protease YdiL (CAAX protease family)